MTVKRDSRWSSAGPLRVNCTLSDGRNNHTIEVNIGEIRVKEILETTDSTLEDISAFLNPTNSIPLFAGSYRDFFHNEDDTHCPASRCSL
jgi:hypothetical protein